MNDFEYEAFREKLGLVGTAALFVVGGGAYLYTKPSPDEISVIYNDVVAEREGVYKTLEQIPNHSDVKFAVFDGVTIPVKDQLACLSHAWVQQQGSHDVACLNADGARVLEALCNDTYYRGGWHLPTIDIPYECKITDFRSSLDNG